MPTVAKKRNITTELKTLITHAIHDALNDPDFGLELTEHAKQRLHAIRTKKEKLIPLSDSIKKL